MKLSSLILFLLFFVSLICATTKEHSAVSADTLAVIDRAPILAHSFVEFYQKKIAAAGLSDNIETRIGVLRTIVEDEILIAYARQKQFDKTPSAQKELSRIRLQALLNAYTEQTISPLIHVSESDVREYFVRMNTKVKVRHLYAPTKEEADRLFAELSKGKTFEELAKQIFTDPQLQKSGGLLGYITADEMDPLFEETAFSISVGSISKPLRTVQGYSILKVEERNVHPLLTETEFARVKEKLRPFVHKRKFEEAARKFTATLRSTLEIQCDERLMEKLLVVLRNRSSVAIVEDPAKNFTRKELQQPIVRSNNGYWDVERLVAEMKRSTERQWNWIKNIEDLQDYAAGLMLRTVMETEAKNRHLDSDFRYQSVVDEQFDNYLLIAAESEFKKKIIFTTDSLRSYYFQNRSIYRTEPEFRLSGILLDRKTAVDSVRMLLQNGNAFGELARRFSIQSATAANRGDMGFFKGQEIVEMDESLRSIQPGIWYGPIIEGDKYLFLQCTEMKRSSFRPFDEVKNEINETLITTTWLKQRSKYVETLKNKIQWNIFPERLESLLIVE